MPRDPDLLVILQGYGIPTGPFAALLHQAVQQRWTVSELLSRLYASPEFAQMFPGIFGPSGELVMTPGQYLQTRREYQHIAQVYGLQLSDQEFGRLVAGAVSPQEFLDRAEAAARLSENPAYMRAFQHYAQAAGLGRVGPREAFDAMLGMAPKEFYDVWEQTVIRSMSELSGVDLSDRMVRKIQKLSPTRIQDTEEAKQTFEQLAQQIRTTIPLSRIYKFGITKSDLLQLEFGGPRQAEIAERVRRVLATEEEFRTGQRARSTLYPTQGGGVQALGGQRERPQVQ